ncbi:hypothetical protein [Synechocystis sp. PCC 7509]|uniref:hypothetical protein n=1 Tax=Synechocystis sp. PCC 7509 TaxID=927677 RepID=UPI0002ACD6FE|nr:hypothetical protein [Synechocystis sp. PCC 7509]
MSISSINRIKTIANKLVANSSSIVTIYENTGLTVGDTLIANHKIISFNCFIKNLKAFASIHSLAEVALPDFDLDDSATDKLYKTLNVEWGSARKQITLYISNQLNTSPDGSGWYKVGSLSLLNPSGYPYRIYNLMDLFTDNLAIELGDNGKIGIQIEDVGYGLLDATDTVTIHGSYSEEIFVQTPDPIYTLPVTPPPVVIPPTSSLLQVPGMIFRISASELNLQPDEAVSTWMQPQASFLKVIQNEFSYQPIYKPNLINGKNAVYFDGSKYMNVQMISNPTVPVPLIPTIGDWLIFVVAKFEDTATSLFTSFTNYDAHTANVSLNGNSNVVGYMNESTSTYEELYAPFYISDWTTYMVYKQGNTISACNSLGSRYIVGDCASSLSSNGNYLEKVLLGCNYNQNNFLNGYVAELGVVAGSSLEIIDTIGNFFKNYYNLPWINMVEQGGGGE